MTKYTLQCCDGNSVPYIHLYSPSSPPPLPFPPPPDPLIIPFYIFLFKPTFPFPVFTLQIYYIIFYQYLKFKNINIYHEQNIFVYFINSCYIYSIITFPVLNHLCKYSNYQAPQRSPQNQETRITET